MYERGRLRLLLFCVSPDIMNEYALQAYSDILVRAFVRLKAFFEKPYDCLWISSPS